LWWLIFFFGWAVFPAFGVFARGVAGLVDTRSEPPAANARERELLEALQSSGELTPAQAAMETSLTVNEADEMLKDLAAKGHLDVRVRGGGLFYGLWETDSEAARKRLGNE
jgi:predicted ArsR family transcriptional regulator